METIKQGQIIYEFRYPLLRAYEIERVVEQGGKMYAEVLVGYNKDKSKLIQIDGYNSSLDKFELKEKILERIERNFERGGRVRK